MTPNHDVRNPRSTASTFGIPTQQNQRSSIPKVKPIAFVLPQFHPIRENDEWWGQGFTEWRNVVKARPLFRGHQQPHMPADLGFYDLRLVETQVAQADMARRYGIFGFCYYHYWFNGHRVLERPVQNILSNKSIDLPFMLCWANENWSRRWDGSEREILLRQEYSREDFRRHANALLPYFEDSRYIRIDGRPVFAIYNTREIPDPIVGLGEFRAELKRNGVDVFLCSVETFFGGTSGTPAAAEFEAGIEFQPHTPVLSERLLYRNNTKRPIFGRHGRLQRLLRSARSTAFRRNLVLSYDDVIHADTTASGARRQNLFPGVCPGWDNTARRRLGGAFILTDSTPLKFHKWICQKCESTTWDNLPAPFLFVNAWNEWAEGNHLEPCERWGKAYLEALNSALEHFES